MIPHTSEPFDTLRNALEALGVRYAVGGSWASAAYGEARFTNDVDILVDLPLASLERFLSLLSSDFYFDLEHARDSLGRGRPFNLIYMPTALKFDLFPARAFPLGMDELDRCVLLVNSGLSEVPTPFVSVEDILTRQASLVPRRRRGVREAMARHSRHRSGASY